MFEQSSLEEPRNVLGDWIVRGGIGIAFMVFGAEEFPAAPGSEWVSLHQQIGWGQWFRYVCTMASAALILIFVVGAPGDSIISIILFLALTAFGLARRH